MKTALCVISFYHGRMRGAASSRFNSLKKIIVKSPCSQYQKYFFRSPSMLTTYLYLILQKINYSTSIKIYAKPNGSNSCLSFSRKLLIGRAKKFVFYNYSFVLLRSNNFPFFILSTGSNTSIHFNFIASIFID